MPRMQNESFVLFVNISIRFCCLKTVFTVRHASYLDNTLQRSKHSGKIFIILKFKIETITITLPKMVFKF